MDMITTIFSSLGIDSSLFIQLAIYLITFVILLILVFNPYFKASEKRRINTSGSLETLETADQMIKLSEEKYDNKAKQINEEVALIFQQQRKEAMLQIEKLQADSNSKSKEILNQTQQKLSGQLEQAQSQISLISKDIAAVIVQQLLSKRGKN